MRRNSALAILAMMFATVTHGEEPPKSAEIAEVLARPSKTYATPREVFDAFRRASDKRDWRTVYYCWTPRARQALVFEAYFSCGMKPEDPDVIALLKKFNISEKAFNAEFYKRYQQKYGVDLEKEYRKYEADMKARLPVEKPAVANKIEGPVPFDGGQAPPRVREDLDLLHEAVSATIADKEGFFAAASNLFSGRNPDTAPDSPLETLTVCGDKATGNASSIVYAYEGATLKKVGKKISTTFHFRKVSGGWFLDFNGGK